MAARSSAARSSALPSRAEGPPCLVNQLYLVLARSTALFSSVELLVTLQVFLFSSFFSRRFACATVVEVLADMIVTNIRMCVRVDQHHASYVATLHCFLQREWDQQEDQRPAGHPANNQHLSSQLRGARPLMPQQRD